jgi:hypothetical protein
MSRRRRAKTTVVGIAIPEFGQAPKKTEHAGHQPRRADKARVHHGHRGNTKTFGCYGVIQTARRATASVADAVDDAMPAPDPARKRPRPDDLHARRLSADAEEWIAWIEQAGGLF